MKISRKKLAIWVVAAVAVAAAVIVPMRWKAWFGQPSEPPYSPLSEPGRIVLTLGNKGEMSRMVSWQCDSAMQDSWLELGAEPVVSCCHASLRKIPARGEVFQSRAGKAAYYHASLDSLAPNTTFWYRVATGGKYSPWHQFRTYGTGPRPTAFIFVGDVQDTIGGNANAYLRQAVAAHPDAELLVCGGDLVERPRDIDWAEAFRSLDSLRMSMPVLVATGNHDYLKGLPMKLERRFSLVFPYFLDSMVGENQVYDVEYGDVHFFLLDSTRELPYLLSQRQWLKRRLDASTAKWKVVVCHHPLYSLRGRNNLTQKWVFADVIEDGGVDLVLQGHEHNYARKNVGETVYTVSHCSPKTYSHKDLSQFDATCLNSRFYQYVRTHGDTLTMVAYEVYGGEPIDSVSIIKK